MNTKNQTTTPITAPNLNAATDSSIEVLYQKLGDKWFAFSEVDGEVFFGSISADEIAKWPTA